MLLAVNNGIYADFPHLLETDNPQAMLQPRLARP
jgi:hypothetical protein